MLRTQKAELVQQVFAEARKLIPRAGDLFPGNLRDRYGENSSLLSWRPGDRYVKAVVVTPSRALDRQASIADSVTTVEFKVDHCACTIAGHTFYWETLSPQGVK